MKHFLTDEDLKHLDYSALMEFIIKVKKTRGKKTKKPLLGKSVGMIFSKTSTRTRLSFEVGIAELGGHPIFLNAKDLQLGHSETIADTARVLSRYLHAVVIRTYEQKEVEEFAKFSTIPVINALTNQYHPCQTLTDMFTIYEKAGRLKDINLTYIGDGSNNMANSLILSSKLAGVTITICSPKEYAPSKQICERKLGMGKVIWEKNPVQAVKNADFIYTDVWVSMGFEAESKARLAILTPYQLNKKLMKKAPSNVLVMHCLPAHRGLEITDDVIDGPRSIVFDQAENRLHAQKALLYKLFE